jgi:hypothetical protein
MTARAGAPPGRRTGPGGEPEAGEDRRLAGGTSATIVPHAIDEVREPVYVSQCVAEFVTTLLALARSYGDIPIYGSPEWAALDRLDPRRFASVVRAAECWRTEGTDQAIRARLLDELEVADLIARWRVRMAGHDLRGDTDWGRVFDVVQARREVAA